jgi:hypothetical protein
LGSFLKQNGSLWIHFLARFTPYPLKYGAFPRGFYGVFQTGKHGNVLFTPWQFHKRIAPKIGGKTAVLPNVSFLFLLQNKKSNPCQQRQQALCTQRFVLDTQRFVLDT